MVQTGFSAQPVLGTGPFGSFFLAELQEFWIHACLPELEMQLQDFSEDLERWSSSQIPQLHQYWLCSRWQSYAQGDKIEQNIKVNIDFLFQCSNNINTMDWNPSIPVPVQVGNNW